VLSIKHLKTAFFSWIPLAVAITLLCLLIYATSQQVLRQSANDPQIQMSENEAEGLVNSNSYYNWDIETPEGKGMPINIINSLSPFTMYFDGEGHLQRTNIGIEQLALKRSLPHIPSDVFAYTKEHIEDRFTWQPYSDVRIAAVITYYSGKHSGFVLVGRSLREVEKREDQIFQLVLIGWAVTIIVSFIASFSIKMVYNK
jgi:hypothetical protein